MLEGCHLLNIFFFWLWHPPTVIASNPLLSAECRAKKEMTSPLEERDPWPQNAWNKNNDPKAEIWAHTLRDHNAWIPENGDPSDPGDLEQN